MKRRSVILHAIALLLLLNGCIKHVTDDGKPYYRFTEDDKSKLLIAYDSGKVLVYKNQFNEEISFKIVSSVNGKTSYATGTFWGSYVVTDYYYDQQDILMEYAEGYRWSNCEIVLKRAPADANPNLQPRVEGTSTFISYIRFPLWNSDSAIFINFNSSTSSMTINEKLYPKVSVFKSGSTAILEPDNTLPRLPRNVNTLYYDQNAGIIGFDDVGGKIWRLQ